MGGDTGAASARPRSADTPSPARTDTVRQLASGIPIGALIKAYRDIQGLTQAVVADRAGLTLRYQEMLEQGVRIPSLDVLQRIAAALGVSAAFLIDDTRPGGPAQFDDIEAALLDPDGASDSKTPDASADDYERACEHWATAVEHYRAAVRSLPALLTTAARLARIEGDEQARRQAVDIYRLAEAITRRGRADLSLLAARRADELDL